MLGKINVVISNIFQGKNHRVKSLIFYQTGVLLSMDYSLFKKDIFQVYEFGVKMLWIATMLTGVS